MLSKNLQSRFHPFSPLHGLLAKQQISGFLDRLLEQEPIAVREPNVAETFIGRRAWSVVGIGGRREPSLVDPTAMPAVGVEIIRMQPESPAGVHERPWHPARLQAEQSLAFIDRILNMRSIRHNR